MKDMIEVYFKDLSSRVRTEIRDFGYVDKDILNNKLPVAVILPEDVENFSDFEITSLEEYDDEFTDYSNYNIEDSYDDFENDEEFDIYDEERR